MSNDDAVKMARGMIQALDEAQARIEALERGRDSAVQGREGQLRNTLAFQAEAEERKQLLIRWLATDGWRGATLLADTRKALEP